MATYYVEATKTIDYSAEIEANTLEEAQAILNDMIMDDFNEDGADIYIGDLTRTDEDGE